MMDRKSIKKNMNIISAFAEDKVIQIINEKGEWVDLTERDGLPIETIAEDPNSFRIKPEPKYRPFANTEECWAEMLRHQPFGWVKDEKSDEYFNVYCVSNNSEGKELFKRMFERCVFIDKNPFGVKDEED